MARHDKHGFSEERIYRIWSGMKRRCLSKKHVSYADYGGRGITVSESWMKFLNYYADMKDSYEKHCVDYGIKNTTLERIDNDKGYSKENCKWATLEEQRHNQRGFFPKPKIDTDGRIKIPRNKQKTYVERKYINGQMRSLIISYETNEILNVI